MTNRQRTELVGIAILSAIVAWDVYVAVHPVKGDTFSEIVKAHRESFLLPWAWGVLAAHFFLPGLRPHLAITFSAFAAIVAAALHFDFVVHPAIAMSSGVLSGSLLWSQRDFNE